MRLNSRILHPNCPVEEQLKAQSRPWPAGGQALWLVTWTRFTPFHESTWFRPNPYRDGGRSTNHFRQRDSIPASSPSMSVNIWRVWAATSDRVKALNITFQMQLSSSFSLQFLCKTRATISFPVSVTMWLCYLKGLPFVYRSSWQVTLEEQGLKEKWTKVSCNGQLYSEHQMIYNLGG